MRPVLSLALLLVASSLLAEASLTRVLRQSQGEAEQEATTAKSTNNQQQQQSGRLYPDIPQQPNFVPPFNGVGPIHYPAIPHHHGGQTPFAPFSIPAPTGRLNADQQPAPFGRVLPPPRPMTPAERLQSQSFANGLGRRLLSLVGIETGNSTSGGDSGEINSAQKANGSSLEETMRALQNATVLQQLNKGLNSIYGGLSKMYNSTVQEQLTLLQERFKAETQNSTNPWHQRMAVQVPQFFKQAALKVGEAQEQLNRVWQDVSQAAQGNATVLSRSASTNGPNFFDQQQDFFNNIGRSLGFGGGGAPAQPKMMAQQGPARAGQGSEPAQTDLAIQLRDFWQTQVQPQIGMVRNQVGRVWRDLTASGAFSPETFARSRTMYKQGSGQNESSDLVDDILKEVEMNGSEYTLIEAKGENDPRSPADNKPQANDTGVKLSPQMQNRLIAMQRELNQLWMGLTSSLQGAINNIRSRVNPQPFALDAMASNNINREQADPSVNEIDGKVKNLSKLQRDADMVFDTVQQQQREAQQNQNFGDRFKNFFNSMNVDLSGVNQLPDRIGQSFSRFGVAVGDMWNQIPGRWDNFMQNMRPQQNQQQQQQDVDKSKMMSVSSTTTENPNPER